MKVGEYCGKRPVLIDGIGLEENDEKELEGHDVSVCVNASH